MPLSGDRFLIWSDFADAREIEAGPMASLYFAELLKIAYARGGHIPVPRDADLVRHVFNVLGGRSQSTDRSLRAALPRLLVEGGLLRRTECGLVVNDIERFDPRSEQTSSYTQLWVKERGDFLMRLGPESRGLAAHLQRICNQRGAFVYDADAVVRGLGWGADRNLLRRGRIAKWLNDLWNVGFLIQDTEKADRAVIGKFTALQPESLSHPGVANA